DPASLRLRRRDRVAGVLLGLLPLVRRVLLRVLASLLRVGVGGRPGLALVPVGLGPGLLGLQVGRVDRSRGLLLGFGADLLRALLGLGEDGARPLPYALQLALDSVRSRLVARSGLEPVGETRQELLNLVLVVTPARRGESCVANPVETGLVDWHASDS